MLNILLVKKKKRITNLTQRELQRSLKNYISQKAQRVNRCTPIGCLTLVVISVQLDMTRTRRHSSQLRDAGRAAGQFGSVRSPLSVGVWIQPSVHEKRSSGAVSVCYRGAASLVRLDGQNCAPVGFRLRRYRSTFTATLTFYYCIPSVICRHDSLC